VAHKTNQSQPALGMYWDEEPMYEYEEKLASMRKQCDESATARKRDAFTLMLELPEPGDNLEDPNDGYGCYQPAYQFFVSGPRGALEQVLAAIRSMLAGLGAEPRTGNRDQVAAEAVEGGAS